MRCVVTGAAGFIGSSLADRLLAEGHTVVGVDCFTPYYSRVVKEGNLAAARGNPRFRLDESDLRTADLGPVLGGAEMVFHLAAQAGVDSFGEKFREYADINIIGTHRLLEAARRAGSLRLLVYASSASVYGDVPVPMREDGPVNPTTPYGITKLAGEQLSLQYSARMGVPAMSLRFFNVFGPRQRPDMAFTKLAVAILTGAEFPLKGDGLMERDFTEVGDILDALAACADRGRPGLVLNAGGGHRVALRRAIEVMESVSGTRARVRREEARPGEMKRNEADTARLRREFGFAPRVSLEEGLARQFAWVKANLSLLAER